MPLILPMTNDASAAVSGDPFTGIGCGRILCVLARTGRAFGTVRRFGGCSRGVFIRCDGWRRGLLGSGLCFGLHTKGAAAEDRNDANAKGDPNCFFHICLLMVDSAIVSAGK